MPAPGPQLAPPDLVMQVLLAAAVGQPLAEAVGSYAVILFCALLGSAWALTRREPSTRVGAAWFVLLLTLSTTVVTASISYVIDRYAHVGVSWLLAPVAIVVAAIGQDWLHIAKWIASTAADAIKSRVSK